MELLLPPLTNDLTAQQKGWLTLAHKKVETFEALQKGELEIQGFLNGYETMDLATIQTALSTAKNKTADFKAQRLHFTGMIDERLVKPAMEFEKRSQELIDKVAKKELELRVAAEQKSKAGENLEKEKAQLTAHVKNEFVRIATEYKNGLIQAITHIYTTALTQKIKAKDIPAYVEASVGQLAAVVPSKFVKFERKLVDDDTAKLIFAGIEKYNHVPDYEAAVNKLRTETFEMYANDLKNADAAIESINQMAEEQQAANNEEWDLESSTNTLMSSASTGLVMSGTKLFRKIRKTLR
jgi:hypothetical protein